MGKVVITLKVYPEDTETDLQKICEDVKKIISDFGGEYLEHKETPIAFGLKALEIKFSYPDQEFNEDELKKKIREVEGVSDVEVSNVTLSPF